MLISTSTNVMAEISTVSGVTFSAVAPYIYLVIALVISFYISERLIDLVYGKQK
jgi:ABC-type arginine transport system permease subunit